VKIKLKLKEAIDNSYIGELVTNSEYTGKIVLNINNSEYAITPDKLQEGQWPLQIRIKDEDSIMATLDENNRYHGSLFADGMTKYCNMNSKSCIQQGK